MSAEPRSRPSLHPRRRVPVAPRREPRKLRKSISPRPGGTRPLSATCTCASDDATAATEAEGSPSSAMWKRSARGRTDGCSTLPQRATASATRLMMFDSVLRSGSTAIIIPTSWATAAAARRKSASCSSPRPSGQPSGRLRAPPLPRTTTFRPASAMRRKATSTYARRASGLTSGPVSRRFPGMKQFAASTGMGRRAIRDRTSAYPESGSDGMNVPTLTSMKSQPARAAASAISSPAQTPKRIIRSAPPGAGPHLRPDATWHFVGRPRGT